MVRPIRNCLSSIHHQHPSVHYEFFEEMHYEIDKSDAFLLYLQAIHSWRSFLDLVHPPRRVVGWAYESWYWHASQIQLSNPRAVSANIRSDTSSDTLKTPFRSDPASNTPSGSQPDLSAASDSSNDASASHLNLSNDSSEEEVISGQNFLEKLLLDLTYNVDMQAEWLEMAKNLEAYNKKQSSRWSALTLSLTSVIGLTRKITRISYKKCCLTNCNWPFHLITQRSKWLFRMGLESLYAKWWGLIFGPSFNEVLSFE